MKRLTALPALAAAVIAQATIALAVEPDEVLADPALETRAREIGAQLRCVVCQSQSIDDSNAPLAKDLRLLVRERLVAGESNEEVVDYVVERYGDYVLLKPPLRSDTLLLWTAPALMLLLGGGAAVWLLGRRKKEEATPPNELSDEERAEIARLTE